MALDTLSIRGARHHNLKNIDIDLPKNRLVVISGLSGSGKSTLAFDTIYAEGQRRYVESLSTYARQFLEMMDKPDVDSIEGLSPSISIQQKTTSRNPRSTVGTTTEIYDYLRLLYARVGTPYCTGCGRKVSSQSAETITDTALREFDGARVVVLAPVVRHKKGTHEKVLDRARRDGHERARVDGDVWRLDEDMGGLDKNKWHDIEIVMDRLAAQKEERSRLYEAVEAALKAAAGYVVISDEEGGGAGSGSERTFSQNNACPHCGITVGELEPRTFSFNSPFGMCEECHGIGLSMVFDPALIVPDRSRSLGGDAIAPWAGMRGKATRTRLLHVRRRMGIDLDVPVSQLSDRELHLLMHGSLDGFEPGGGGKRGAGGGTGGRGGAAKGGSDEYAEGDDDLEIDGGSRRGGRGRTRGRPAQRGRAGRRGGGGGGGDDDEYDAEDYEESVRMALEMNMPWMLPPMYKGLIGELEKDYAKASTEKRKDHFRQYMRDLPCRACRGGRLKKEALAVTVGGKNIGEVCSMSIHDSHDFVSNLKLTDTEMYIAKDVLKEVRSRLEFLLNVGLEYLNLNRPSSTLSGGESQRIRLATQIGSNLSGVLYVLDEPTIGLHHRDNARLIKTLGKLRDLGNTVIVVEHDEEVIRSSDWLLDMGPGAGIHGGSVVFTGTLSQILKGGESITGKYLKDNSLINLAGRKRVSRKESLVVRAARANNLKSIDVEFPLGKLVVVTGVSGSGKSTLVNDVLLAALESHFYASTSRPGDHDRIEGIKHIDRIISINQSPIGRTPRSNPATYIGAFTPIRDLYASTASSKERGYAAGQFSFNVENGRCFACEGDGVKKIEMQFLSDVYVKCDECQGRRYNSETLAVRYKGRNIADVLEMTAHEALDFFKNVSPIRRKMQTLNDVGLGYIKLGQSSTTLSGGEAQRIKLASELSKRSTGKTVYILDEPTTGLHFADVQKLLEVLDRLVSGGNTVIIIEHNMDIIKNADWIVDLGPEGGDEGGRVVAAGTPAEVAKAPGSYTAKYLRKSTGRK